MAMETDVGVWDKIVAAGIAGVAGLITWVFKNTHARIDRIEEHMVTKEEFERHAKLDESVQATIQQELTTSRNHVAKIFDQMRDMEKNSHEHHVALLNAINQRNRE